MILPLKQEIGRNPLIGMRRKKENKQMKSLRNKNNKQNYKFKIYFKMKIVVAKQI